MALVPEKYSRRESTPLTAEVKEGKTGLTRPARRTGLAGAVRRGSGPRRRPLFPQLRKVGAMPTLAVGMLRTRVKVNMPTASVGMAPVPTS